MKTNQKKNGCQGKGLQLSSMLTIFNQKANLQRDKRKFGWQEIELKLFAIMTISTLKVKLKPLKLNGQPKEKELMATIFEREFRREKNLELAKRQADLKKPTKRDNTINQKKQDQLNNLLHQLEDDFFKHVAEDPEQLQIIKKRGDAGGDASVAQAKPAA